MNPVQDFQIFLTRLGLDSNAVEAVTEQTKLLKVDAGQVLLHQGELQQYAYFIHTGILKAEHDNDSGVALAKEFYFEQELCFLYYSWLSGTLAQYRLEAVDNAELVRIPIDLLDSPNWQQVKMGLLSQQLIYKEQKEAFLLLNTPEQRYLYLVEHRPLWVSKLHNHQLACYIGINPVSLSRLKARISQGANI
ncbi:cyclic nucleotide-binding domain-containing protein [Shewanella mesophila]|nr:cyclic nucleotide-binding domain-containing protein [Shewanella mesophila]